MADKATIVTPTENVVTETEIVKKDFWATYSKTIIYAGSAIIILLAGYFGYNHFIKAPKEIQANEAVFAAENLFDKMATTGFNKDSINIVLNSGVVDGANVKGLLKVINEFGGTAAANRATYMAGAAYLHNKEFDKAIKFLNDFSANGASQLDIKRNIMLGHAYAELKKNDDALSAYKKAASINEKDEAFTADALITAAAFAASINNNKEAIELYQKAKDNYPTFPTVQGGEVDKNLAKLGVTK